MQASHLWQKGQSANPGGRRPGAISWQKYETRVGHIFDEYSYEEILELNEKIQKKNKVPLSSFDCMIVCNIAAVYRGDGKERERLLDRLWGKSVQRIGGENAGEGIKINCGASIPLENLDNETLAEVLMVLENARQRNSMPVIEQEKTPLIQLESGGVDSESED